MRKVFVLVLSLLGLQAVSMSTASAQGPVEVAGTYALVFDFSTLELIPQGQQCVVHVEDTATFSGDLVGVTETVGAAETRFFATCESLTGDFGIRSLFHAVEHLVLSDGTEATLESVGRTDADGNFVGTSALREGLHGVQHFAGSAGQAGTYTGQVVWA